MFLFQESIPEIVVKNEPHDLCSDSEGDDSMWPGEEEKNWEACPEPSVTIKTEDLTQREDSFDDYTGPLNKRSVGYRRKMRILSRKKKLKAFRLETMKPFKVIFFEKQSDIHA